MGLCLPDYEHEYDHHSSSDGLLESSAWRLAESLLTKHPTVLSTCFYVLIFHMSFVCLSFPLFPVAPRRCTGRGRRLLLSTPTPTPTRPAASTSPCLLRLALVVPHACLAPCWVCIVVSPVATPKKHKTRFTDTGRMNTRDPLGWLVRLPHAFNAPKGFDGHRMNFRRCLFPNGAMAAGAGHVTFPIGRYLVSWKGKNRSLLSHRSMAQ